MDLLSRSSRQITVGDVLINVYPHLDPQQKEVSPLEKKIKRMNLNVEADLHDAFKAATAAQGKNMTDVLMKFIEDYVSKHGVAPKKKPGRP
jgi:ParG